MNSKIIWAVRGILIALILCWMITIFDFSSADGTESSSLSDKITIKVVYLVEPDYDNLSLGKQELLFNKVSFIVRKTGHFGEYGILAVLWMMLLLSFEKMRKVKWYIAIIVATAICFIYAASDEFHQGFVDGRTPKIVDVCIDTIGGLAGAGSVFIVWMIFRRRNERLGKKC